MNLRAAVFLPLALLSACVWAGDAAQREARERFPDDPVAALYANTFTDIQEYYIEPISARTLSVAGLQAAIPQTSHIALNVAGGSVSLMQDGQLLRRMPEPADNDAAGWAAVTSASLATLRQAVPGMESEAQPVLDRAVFTGIIGKLDRFTRYAAPEQATRQRAARDGFGGIGIIIDTSKAGAPAQDLLVGQVLPNTPAAKGGLVTGDHILTVDGKPMTGLTADKVVDQLRGPIGSKVTVGILHAGKPATITMVRSLIVEPSVIARTQPDGIGIFVVAEFNHDTGETLASAISQAQAAAPGGLKGILLDLRGDPGGLLDQAADVSSIFIKQGRVVWTRGRNPSSMQVFDADSTRYLTGLPLVVLVDGGSASAAEIVSAALQDRGRAVLVGSSSYGKGTVQVVLTLENDGELTLTWARLFSPGNTVLHDHGVVPLFCTSGKTSDAGVIAATLSRKPSIDTGPRAMLDKDEWQKLRASCPPEQTAAATGRDAPPDVDLSVATKLLTDPALYAQALARSKILGTPVKLSAMAALPPP